MKILDGRIELIAAHKSATIDILKNVYFDADDNKLYATDGFVCVKVPVKAIPGDDASGIIPLKTFKDARRSTFKMVETVASGESYPIDTVKKFFDVPCYAVVALDAEKLYRIARAICDSGKTKDLFVKLCLPQVPGDPMVIMPVEETEATGVGALPPIRWGGEFGQTMLVLRTALANGNELDTALCDRLRKVLEIDSTFAESDGLDK